MKIYNLMNKEVPVAIFMLNEDPLGNQITPIQQINPLPIGESMNSVKSWLESRKASKHNAHLKQLMHDCGCDQISGFIKVTHAASLNDTFWIKERDEDILWDRISFYKNDFDETISRLAFEGLSLYGEQFSSTSPELTTDGSFKKCWVREDSGIYLYKRGTEHASNAGMEPYCEAMASEIAQKICKQSVHYDVVNFRNNIASKCKLFTSEEYGYVPMHKVDEHAKTWDYRNMLEYFTKIGSENEFREMVMFDMLTFNPDRHLGNFGVLIDNDTQEILKIANNFDFNLSLFPYLTTDELTKQSGLLKYSPQIGTDFTRVGQLILDSELRTKLINLKGFEFSFRGDDKFSTDRVKALEAIIGKQIDAILDKKTIYFNDVFPEPTQKEQGIDLNDVLQHLKEGLEESEYNVTQETINNDKCIVVSQNCAGSCQCLHVQSNSTLN